MFMFSNRLKLHVYWFEDTINPLSLLKYISPMPFKKLPTYGYIAFVDAASDKRNDMGY